MRATLPYLGELSTSFRRILSPEDSHGSLPPFITRHQNKLTTDGLMTQGKLNITISFKMSILTMFKITKLKSQ